MNLKATLPVILHIHNSIHSIAQVTETQESPLISIRRGARLEEGVSGTTVGRLDLYGPPASGFSRQCRLWSSDRDVRLYAVGVRETLNATLNVELTFDHSLAP